MGAEKMRIGNYAPIIIKDVAISIYSYYCHWHSADVWIKLSLLV